MFIRPLVRKDLSEVATFGSQAFKNDEAFVWVYPRMAQYPDDLRRSQLIRLRTRFVEVGAFGFVMVTEPSDADWNGQPVIVGYSFWKRYGDDESGKKWPQDSVFKKFERYLLSWEAWYEIHVLNRTADLARIKAWESKPYFPLYTLLEPRLHLSGLCVSLEHQRRGIGMKLLQHGQEIATEESIPVTLKASVIGRLLYQKCGFKIIDQRALEGGPDTVVMCWEPEHLRGKWLEDVGGGKSNVIGRT